MIVLRAQNILLVSLEFLLMNSFFGEGATAPSSFQLGSKSFARNGQGIARGGLPPLLHLGPKGQSPFESLTRKIAMTARGVPHSLDCANVVNKKIFNIIFEQNQFLIGRSL